MQTTLVLLVLLLLTSVACTKSRVGALKKGDT